MRLLLILSILSTGILAQFTPQPAAAGASAQIEGHVYYQDGRPVVGATIDPFAFYVATSGPRPGLVTTDENGHYILTTTFLGETRIVAYKVAEGYPDVNTALFSPGKETMPILDVRAGSQLRNVDIHFGPPDGSIQGELRDANTKAVIANARLKLSSSENPDIFISTNVPASGTFFYSLPERPINIEVTAPGYADWHYVNSTTRQTSITLRSADHPRMVIELKPNVP